MTGFGPAHQETGDAAARVTRQFARKKGKKKKKAAE
jgi:hypothetical protein